MAIKFVCEVLDNGDLQVILQEVKDIKDKNGNKIGEEVVIGFAENGKCKTAHAHEKSCAIAAAQAGAWKEALTARYDAWKASQAPKAINMGSKEISL